MLCWKYWVGLFDWVLWPTRKRKEFLGNQKTNIWGLMVQYTLKGVIAPKTNCCKANTRCSSAMEDLSEGQLLAHGWLRWNIMVSRAFVTKTEFLQRISWKTVRKRSGHNEHKQKTKEWFSKIKSPYISVLVSHKSFIQAGMVLLRGI